MKTELNGHVIALFCHGIWSRGQHLGLKYIDEAPKIDRHGIAAELATRENATLLTSGGWTRPDLYDSGVTISEAMGMKEFIQKSGTLGNNVPIFTEDWARDSFENCLFSMFAFCHAKGHYPERFTAVSRRFKANRILLVGNALGIPNFEFVGVENPDSRNLLHAICAETGYLASLLHYQTQTLVDHSIGHPRLKTNCKAGCHENTSETRQPTCGTLERHMREQGALERRLKPCPHSSQEIGGRQFVGRGRVEIVRLGTAQSQNEQLIVGPVVQQREWLDAVFSFGHKFDQSLFLFPFSGLWKEPHGRAFPFHVQVMLLDKRLHEGSVLWRGHVLQFHDSAAPEVLTIDLPHRHFR